MSLVITGVFEEILVHYRAPYHGENFVDTMHARVTKQFYQHRRTDNSLLALCARMMGPSKSSVSPLTLTTAPINIKQRSILLSPRYERNSNNNKNTARAHVGSWFITINCSIGGTRCSNVIFLTRWCWCCVAVRLTFRSTTFQPGLPQCVESPTSVAPACSKSMRLASRAKQRVTRNNGCMLWSLSAA